VDSKGVWRAGCKCGTTTLQSGRKESAGTMKRASLVYEHVFAADFADGYVQNHGKIVEWSVPICERAFFPQTFSGGGTRGSHDGQ